MFEYKTLDNLILTVDELDLTEADWESITAMEEEFRQDTDLLLYLMDEVEVWNFTHPKESKTVDDLLTVVAINEYLALAASSSAFDYYPLTF